VAGNLAFSRHAISQVGKVKCLLQQILLLLIRQAFFIFLGVLMLHEVPEHCLNLGVCGDLNVEYFEKVIVALNGFATSMRGNVVLLGS